MVVIGPGTGIFQFEYAHTMTQKRQYSIFQTTDFVINCVYAIHVVKYRVRSQEPATTNDKRICRVVSCLLILYALLQYETSMEYR